MPEQRGSWAETQKECGTRRRSWVAGGAGRKELQNPADHLARPLPPQEEGEIKPSFFAGGKGASRESNARLRFYSLPLPHPDGTQPSK